MTNNQNDNDPKRPSSDSPSPRERLLEGCRRGLADLKQRMVAMERAHELGVMPYARATVEKLTQLLDKPLDELGDIVAIAVVYRNLDNIAEGLRTIEARVTQLIGETESLDTEVVRLAETVSRIDSETGGDLELADAVRDARSLAQVSHVVRTQVGEISSNIFATGRQPVVEARAHLARLTADVEALEGADPRYPNLADLPVKGGVN